MGLTIVRRWLGSFRNDKTTIYAAGKRACRRTCPLDVLLYGVWCGFCDSPAAFEVLNTATVRSLPANRPFKALVPVCKILTASR